MSGAQFKTLTQARSAVLRQVHDKASSIGAPELPKSPFLSAALQRTSINGAFDWNPVATRVSGFSPDFVQPASNGLLLIAQIEIYTGEYPLVGRNRKPWYPARPRCLHQHSPAANGAGV